MLDIYWLDIDSQLGFLTNQKLYCGRHHGSLCHQFLLWHHRDCNSDSSKYCCTYNWSWQVNYSSDGFSIISIFPLLYEFKDVHVFQCLSFLQLVLLVLFGFFFWSHFSLPKLSSGLLMYWEMCPWSTDFIIWFLISDGRIITVEQDMSVREHCLWFWILHLWCFQLLVLNRLSLDFLINRSVSCNMFSSISNHKMTLKLINS